MLNLNLNTLLTRLRELPPEKSAIDYQYVMRTFVSAGFLEPEAFATMSIEANPYQPFTLFITGSDESGNVTSGSLIGAPVIVAISGSGEWPLTGSVESSIFITNNFGFNLTEKLILSEAAGNLNLSGSIISASFAPEDKRPYVIFGTVNHTKGNIYNPDINWKVVNISPVSDVVPVNGYTSSVSFVKDETVPLFTINEITSSISDTFQYLYNLGVTASMEADINNVTGSTTMSFNSAEAGITTTFMFFNPETIKAVATASFLANKDTPYNFTASVEYNKGNLYNNNLNWKALQSSTTEDLEGDGTNLNGVSSSFKLDKDIANIVDISELTGSVNDTYTNDYSFNQTASLTQNVNNVTGSVTMSIEVPELGISVTEKFFNPDTETASASLSFESISTDDYNITASVINNKGNESNADINYQITSSNIANYGDITEATSSFELKKDIAVMVTSSLIDGEINDTYKNDYSFNQTASISSSYTPVTVGDTRVRGVARLLVPEAGIDEYSYNTSSLLTGSFEAEVGGKEYNVTASFDLYADTLIDYVLIGGGGAGGSFTGAGGGGGGGAGSIITGSIKIQRGKNYEVNIGAGGINSNGVDSTFVGPLVPLDDIDLYPSFSNATFLIAKGGGSDGSNGGSGGGGFGSGQNVTSCNSLNLGTGGLPVSASVISTSSYDLVELTPTLTGKSGANGVCRSQPFGLSGRFVGHGGGGGGVNSNGDGVNGGRGIIVNWLQINSGSIGGGGAGGYYMNQWTGTVPSGSHGGGTFIGTNAGRENGIPYTGAGGAGKRNNTSNPAASLGPGLGASGSMSIKYPGLPQATGGTITQSGGFTIHTFTGSGQFVFDTDF